MKTRPVLLLTVLVIAAAVTGLWIANSGEFNNETHITPVKLADPKLGVKRVAQSSNPALKSTGPRTVAKASKTALDVMELMPSVTWATPVIPAPGKGVSTASRRVLATASIQRNALPDIQKVRLGQQVQFLLEGQSRSGVVNLITPMVDSEQTVAGSIGPGQQGSFSLISNQSTRELKGHLVDREHKLGYEFKTKGTEVVINKKPLDALMCLMPRYRGPSALSDTAPAAREPIAAQPVLRSRPGAAGVIYLDFDGETVHDPDWNNGITIVAAPALLGTSAISVAQITDVWKQVAEDFLSFNVNVTTVRADYDNAPAGHRALCIITPSDSWYAGYAGGVAYLNSYRGSADGWSNTIPCWVWNNSSTSVMAMTISHEVGHMLNLSHDGTFVTEYYDGHDGTGVTSWGPIMGAPFTRSLIQFSKGEYPGANNKEDDFDIVSGVIAEPSGGNAYAADDHSNGTTNATSLPISGAINNSGFITKSSDIDYFTLKSNGGPLNVFAYPALVSPNLDIQVEVFNSVGTSLGVSAQANDDLTSTLNLILPSPGIYYLAVTGRERPASSGVIGYTNYGSTGAYTLTGSFVPLPATPLITNQPVSQTVNQSAKVNLSCSVLSNSAYTVKWFKVVGSTDVELIGKKALTLSFTSIKASDAGVYKAQITNMTGSEWTDTATLDVHYKPVITSPPSPSKLTVATNDSVNYGVTADGTAPLTYLWKKNGIVIPGETGSSLSITSATWFDAASYTVTVSNSLGSASSKAAVLTVSSKGIFIQQPPVLKNIALGSKASVTVKVVGTAPITYQWFKDGSPIPKATKTTFSWSGTLLDAEGTYFLRATSGGTLGYQDSDGMVVDVQDPPVITAQPTPLTNLSADQTLNLSVVANGTAPVNYQWQLNGHNLSDSASVSGATTASLVINPISWIQKGTYRCLVSNDVGVVTSKNAVVNITSYPVILTQPHNTKIAVNKTGVLKVVAGGTPPFKYQWFKDSVLIPRATAATLSLPKATVATTNGTYSVEVSNTQPLPVSGTVSSNPALVEVENPPVALPLSPMSQIVTVGDTVTITGTATGTPPFSYQWQKGTKNIPGKTDAILTLDNVQTTDSSTYRLVFTNAVGTATSMSSKLSVQTIPNIITQPVAAAVYAYDNVTFSIKATGTATLKYQWFLNGSPVTSTTTAKTATLSLKAVQATEAGNYSVSVTNAVGTDFSADALLTVVPVPTPTLIDVRPTQIIVGSKIMAVGTNLSWTYKVTLNGKNASFVKTRNTELMITAPAGMTSMGQCVIDTRGGQVVWGTPMIWDKDGAENDLFLNAQILTGSGPTGTCDNSTATYSPDDAYVGYGYYKSVWFRWRAPYSASSVQAYIGSNSYHSHLSVASGPALATSGYDLSFIGYIEDHKYNYGGSSNTFNFRVVKDTDYYFLLDSADSYGYPSNAGRTTLKITKLSSAPEELTRSTFDPAEGYVANASLSGQHQWQTNGASAAISAAEGEGSNAAAYVGGSIGTGKKSVSAWTSTGTPPANKPIIRASVDLVIDSVIGTEETFSLSLQDTQHSNILALEFDAAEGLIRSHLKGQEAASTNQIFVPGVTYHADLEVNTTRRTWSISLDGIEIAHGANLPVSQGSIAQFGCNWLQPAVDDHAGIMSFDNVSIWAEELPNPLERPEPPPPMHKAHVDEVPTE